MYWFIERHREDTGFLIGARMVHTYQSAFQTIAVLETETWGRVLVIDGLVQMTDRDEFIYHEMIAHVPVMLHPDPHRVLVVGGGDGGTVRELLRHPEVRDIVLCEIDPKVVEVVRTHWPEMRSVFEDHRVTVVHTDGSQYMQRVTEQFDLVIVDSSDPVSYSRSLFNSHFLQAVYRALRPGGIYVTQCMSPIHHLEFIRGFLQQARRAFPVVRTYTAPAPTYPGGWWNFVIACKDRPFPEGFAPMAHDAHFLEFTRYYNLEIHRQAFAVPNFLAKELAYAS